MQKLQNAGQDSPLLLPEEAHHRCSLPDLPRMSGAARFGQAILLNPASTPIIHMPEVLGDAMSQAIKTEKN